jgi:AraC-like DNA-binding protein
LSKNYQELIFKGVYNDNIFWERSRYMDYHTKVRDSLKYIDENLNHKIDLDDLAKRAYLSKYHYHRIFHKVSGESVTRYITKRRMEKAAGELARTDRPIIDIALEYQYASQESFSRAFLKIYGLTPGKYRRRYGGNSSDQVINLSCRFNKNMNMAA